MKQNCEGEYLCNDCGKGLDYEGLVTLVADDDAVVVPICGRCLWIRRAKAMNWQAGIVPT
jgi:hypothetical protein